MCIIWLFFDNIFQLRFVQFRVRNIHAAMVAAINHMIIFLTREYLRGEQARCLSYESKLDVPIKCNMVNFVSGNQSESAKTYAQIVEMSKELAQWRMYCIELGAIIWSLDQI